MCMSIGAYLASTLLEGKNKNLVSLKNEKQNNFLRLHASL
uniref:Uncharacterized protein n=1 Tax=Anguilla anguilla TaxID=7936 RepID=A0A0E9PLS6_ANGAN